MNDMISQVDIDNLISGSDPDASVKIVTKLTSQYNNNNFSEHEMAIAHEIFILLSQEAEEAVRRIISYNLRNSKTIPHQVAKKLATDISNVALPILKYSELLTDTDLVEIIQEVNSEKHNMFIAQRENLSSIVCNSLIETNMETVVNHLIHNKTANIETKNYATITKKYPNSKVIAQAIVDRGDIPFTLKEKIISNMSKQFSQYLDSTKELNKAQNKQIITKTRENVTINTVDNSSSQSLINDLVERLYSQDKITSSLLINALCNNKIKLFEASIAKLAGIPTENAKILLMHINDNSINLIFKKIKILPVDMQEAMQCLIATVYKINKEFVMTSQKDFNSKLYEKLLPLSNPKKKIPYIDEILDLVYDNYRNK